MLLMTSVSSWIRPSEGLLLSCRWPSWGSGDMHGVMSAREMEKGKGPVFQLVNNESLCSLKEKKKKNEKKLSRHMQLTSRGVVGHALQLLHNVDVQQLKGQEVLRSHRGSVRQD